MPEAPDAILLCGGLGLRLRSVIGNAPKGMAEVAGRPFLELLLRQLARYDFHRVILAEFDTTARETSSRGTPLPRA